MRFQTSKATTFQSRKKENFKYPYFGIITPAVQSYHTKKEQKKKLLHQW